MAEELSNPLFDDEREFLERKKQEYERALRGDVDHLKEQGVQVGKVALVGAGLAGSVWLISKLFGGKSKRKNKKRHQEENEHSQRYGRDAYYDASADDEFELDDEAFALDRSAELYGDDYQADQDEQHPRRSAQQSAQAFMDHDNDDRQLDLGFDDDDSPYSRHTGRNEDEDEFDNGFGAHSHHADRPTRTTHADLPNGRLDFGPSVHQYQQGQSYESPVHADDLAYDDSRRLPESAEFGEDDYSHADADVAWPKTSKNEPSLGKRAGGMVKSFLETNTGKAVAAQAAALVLAYVSKKINDHQPADTTSKNADLANAPATTSFYAPLPTPTQSSPAVSLTYTDAPTEHPAS